MNRASLRWPSLALILAVTLSMTGLAACVIPPAAESSGAPAQRASGPACVEEGRMLNAGFYAFFAPVSYSRAADPAADGFHDHAGYEAALLDALEAMDGAGLQFRRRAIPDWDGIWLQSAGSEFDIVGGGITILDSRTRNADGEQVIRFTNGHISFRQTLLVRTEDAQRLGSYEALGENDQVGVLAGTTGEARFLVLAGLADENGALAPGVRIESPHGTAVATGDPDDEEFVITAARSADTDVMAHRARLAPPPGSGLPQVVYLGDELGEAELLEALRTGAIDAVARGEVGNQEAAHASDGAFAVGAVDVASMETGGFTLSVNDDALIACLNDKLDWLTDNRRIGIGAWLQDPAVFLQRAALWSEAAQ